MNDSKNGDTIAWRWQRADQLNEIKVMLCPPDCGGAAASSIFDRFQTDFALSFRKSVATRSGIRLLPALDLGGE
ncbi:hypothetical protein DU475_06095 [Rhodopseudomonas sp. WA056]|uniref:hypothetical protein n=1 Tax=Rhodopseudomonas sp. WA056 TaxID=2269367 RepID=UPI0005A23003|nr:hypothetical protein [Rhodopseudomonas sp. WA056]NEW86836.1 hypothetical protein [Rhodopseudomonas sp. WA056]